MNKSLGSELIVYAVLLAVLGGLVHYLAPEVARPTLVTGLIGGALCLMWGVRVVWRRRGKALVILTLIPVSYVLLSQTILTWSGRSEGGPEGRIVPILIAVMLMISVAMLIMIAYAGVTVDGRPAGDRNKDLR
jgi:peptidoglycan/LPS O-acetylase OafA/YrhL